MRVGLPILLLSLLASCGKEPESSPSSGSPSVPARWGPEPKEGKANLRLILRVYGKPLNGSGAADGRFRLTLMPAPTGTLRMEGFDPDAEGRFVCEALDPGTYTVEVTSARREFPDWKLAGVQLAAGASPLLRVDLK